MARFGLFGHYGRRAPWPKRRSAARARARCSPALPRTPFCRWRRRPSAAIGLVLAAAGHAAGWPIPRGGAQRISDALAGYLRSLGGQIRTESRVDLAAGRAVVMCDVTPRQLLALAGDRFPARLPPRRWRATATVPGVFKLDWALDGPIPWRARECARAATVHLGGTLEEIAALGSASTGRPPFVLLAQPSLFDSIARARGQTHRLGLLPRSQRVDGGHDRRHRVAGGTLRARLPRAHPGAPSCCTPAALEAATRTWSAATSAAARSDLRQFFLRPTRRLLSARRSRRLSVLLLDAAGRRRPRHVRLPRRPQGASGVSQPEAEVEAEAGALSTLTRPNHSPSRQPHRTAN